jgi:hypothetical protein
LAPWKKNLQSKAEWWEEMFGSFANSEGFDEAVWLGKEYRESLRPKNPPFGTILPLTNQD